MSKPLRNSVRPEAHRVLIVPHCAECGASLQMLLSEAGYQAEMVRLGDAVVVRALELLPQAVLVALNLPGDNAWEVGRRLRAELGSAVRLIGISPCTWEGSPTAWAEAGFDGCLRMPVSPDDLLGLLARTGEA